MPAGYPKDLNFYQTIKTLCNAREVVEDGGTIILVTKSQEGYGSPDTQKQIAGYPTMVDREKALRRTFPSARLSATSLLSARRLTT